MIHKIFKFQKSIFERTNISYKTQKWIFEAILFQTILHLLVFGKLVYRFGFRTEQLSTIVNNLPMNEIGISLEWAYH